MNNRIEIYIVLALAFFAIPGPVNSQPLQTGPAPIHVTAQPSIAAMGVPITISGTSAGAGKDREVKITVTPPAGQPEDGSTPVLITASAGPKGHFSVLFEKTNRAGKYSVKAVSPDGTGTAMAEFTVVEPSSGISQTIDQVIEAADELIVSAQQVANAVEDEINSQPISPPQQEMLDKIGQIKSRLSEMPLQFAVLKRSGPIGGGFQEFLDKYPEVFPVFQPLVTNLEGWRTQAKDENDKIQAQLQLSARSGLQCDNLDNVVQLFNWLAYAFDFIGKPLEIFETVLGDKLIPDLIFDNVKAPHSRDEAKFMFAELAKVGIAILAPELEVIKTAVFFFTDIVAFAEQKLFDKYCEKFQGPLIVKMHVDFYEGVERWLSYDEDLTGHLVLRYAKSESEDNAVSLSGEYEGDVTRFTLWDDFVGLYHDLWLRFSVWFHRDVAPPSLSLAASKLRQWGGKVMTTTYAGPTSFSLPVTGTFIKDKMSLRLGNTGRDIDVNTVKGRIIYILAPPGSPIPTVIDQPAPYRTAQFIIARIIGATPEFLVQVDQQYAVSYIEREFERTVDADDGSFKLILKASVKACNPQCP